MKERKEKPDGCDKGTQDERYYQFLMRLRDSGVTNMYGAVPFLQAQFPELRNDSDQAKAVLLAWFEHVQKQAKSELGCVE